MWRKGARLLILLLGVLLLLALPLYAQALDLNTATVKELESLPGIGPALARRIVAYRREHGPFRSVDDLLKIKGIGPERLNLIKAYLRVRPSAPPGPGVAPSGSSGVIYQWVDEKGVLHFTQFPNEIPARYRSRARPIPFRSAGPGSPAPSSPKPSVSVSPSQPARKTDILGRDLSWYMKEKERLVNQIRRLKAQIRENRRVMRVLRRGSYLAIRGTRTKYGLKLGQGAHIRRGTEYRRLWRINQELEKELENLEYRLQKGLYREAAKALAPPEVLEFLKKDP